jgi:hypothetical protein
LHCAEPHTNAAERGLRVRTRVRSIRQFALCKAAMTTDHAGSALEFALGFSMRAIPQPDFDALYP